MRAPSLTVGIEEEYQIIDPITRDLTPGFDAFCSRYLMFLSTSRGQNQKQKMAII